MLHSFLLQNNAKNFHLFRTQRQACGFIVAIFSTFRMQLCHSMRMCCDLLYETRKPVLAQPRKILGSWLCQESSTYVIMQYLLSEWCLCCYVTVQNTLPNELLLFYVLCKVFYDGWKFYNLVITNLFDMVSNSLPTYSLFITQFHFSRSFNKYVI